jgi:stage V sporulation protein SpoVS
MRFLGLVNTHGSLVLTYMTFGLPLAIWLLKGFYDNIPIQLEQAARIDGATRLQAFILIVMPLSVPGIIATAIYSFIGAWNEYIYAYTFLSKNEMMTLPVGIQRFFAENTTDWPGLMAASFMMSVPVVVLFLLLQRYFVQALTEGAVRQRLQAWALAKGHQVVPHGLRKNAVNALLEAECSVAEVSAITGQDLKTIEHYAKGRNQERLGRSAMLKFERWNGTGK